MLIRLIRKRLAGALLLGAVLSISVNPAFSGNQVLQASGLELKPATGVSQRRINDYRKAQSKKSSDIAQQTTRNGARLDGFLKRLLQRHKQLEAFRRGELSRQAVAPSQAGPFVREEEGRGVQVYVQLSDTSESTLDGLQRIGLEVEVLNHDLKKLQAWVAVDRLDALIDMEVVEKVTVPRYANVHAGSVMTEGDAIIKANQLRAMGFTGSGIRVGIISDGANHWTNARSSGNLPAAGISVYGRCTPKNADPSNCASKRSCNEGTAMAEIIHDIAPDAKLAVGAVSTSLEFIQRVNQLADSFKADIIVDDIGFFGEPYFEDGDVADAVAAVASKVLFVSAAGNSGSIHYEKQYRQASGSRLHDFGLAEGKGSDRDHGVVVPAKTGLLVIMQWNDPFNAASNDYDLTLFDNNGAVGGSYGDQNGAGSDPLEGFCYYNSSHSDQIRWLVVDKYSGQAKRLELFFLGRGAHEYNHVYGSIFGHAGLPSVLTSGAINASDSGHNSIAYYSSRGPSRVDFPSVHNRNKPDIIGIDGVKVSGAGGFSSPFYGTSAAAPHVAGVAALLMSISRSANAYGVSKAIKEGAADLGGAGFDSTYGYGRLNAIKARELLKFGSAVPPVLYLLLLN